MSATAKQLDPVLLWPEGVPGVLGNGPEDRPNLIPFLQPGPRKHAAIVVCPGGGYGGRAPHEADPIAEWLNGLGLSAFVLHYRVSPYRHPRPLQDAQRAIRMIRMHADEWNIDPRRLGILGFSAGGHLAVSAATIFDPGVPDAVDPISRQSCRPDALIGCYPVVSFGAFGHMGSLQNLLGSSPDVGLQLYLSLENRVTPETPPSFLWHTADDDGVPVENSLMLATAMRRHRVPCALHVFPHGNHGLALAPEDPTVRAWTDLCAQWLRDLGFRS